MKTKSIAVILIISVFLIFLPACKDSKKDAKKEDANTQFVPQIYENSSIFASISNMGEGYDEVYKILYLEEDDNYYISLYDLHQLRERIDVYDQNFEYIKTIKGDIGELNPDIATLFAFDINENGDIYLMEYPDSDTAKNRLLLVFDKEGNLKEKIKIDDAKDILYSAAISDLFVEENRFVFVSPWGIQITDRAGKTIKEITNADKSRYVLSTDSDKNGFLYFSCSGSGELKKIDVSDGKEIWSIRSENGESLNRISYSREDGQICAYKTNTLSLYDINGNFLGDICDLRDFEPNLDNIDIQNYGSGMLYSLFYKNNKNIVFAFQAISQSENIIFVDTVKLEAINEEEAAKILEEREEQKDLKKTIKILLPYYDGLSENLIYDYNQSNPGIIIETLYFVEDPALYSPLDYVQYVAMRINAGDDDWDIVYDAFLPYDIYVAKGYFVELDALDTDHIFKDSERYYTNIIDALRDKNGKLYLFPSQINFYIFESLKEPLEVEFSSWREITSKKDLKFYDLGLNTNLIFQYLSNEFVSTRYDDISFDKEMLFSSLDLLLELEQNSFYTHDPKEADFGIGFMYYIDADAYEPKHSLDIMLSNIDGNVDKKYKFTTKGYLICSKSTAQKEAFDFLKYMSDNDMYLGISREKLAGELAAYREKIQEIVPSLGLDMEEYEIKAERFVQDILRIYGKLNYSPMNLNINLSGLLGDMRIKYLEGGITKEAIAEKIENFLWLYENEDK